MELIRNVCFYGNQSLVLSQRVTHWYVVESLNIEKHITVHVLLNIFSRFIQDFLVILKRIIIECGSGRKEFSQRITK